MKVSIKVIFVLFVVKDAHAYVVNDVHDLSKQWVQSEISRAQLVHSWHQDKQELTHLLKIYTHEKNMLEKKIQDSAFGGDSLEHQKHTLAVASQELQDKSYQWRQDKTIFFNRLHTIWLNFPEPLQKQLSEPFYILKNSRAPLSEQYQAMADILHSIEQFNQMINLSKHFISLNERTFLAQVLYLGLNQAWYMTPDKAVVGYGQPSSQGWKWQQLHSEDEVQLILDAFSMYQRQQSLDLVKLPIHLSALN